MHSGHSELHMFKLITPKLFLLCMEPFQQGRMIFVFWTCHGWIGIDGSSTWYDSMQSTGVNDVVLFLTLGAKFPALQTMMQAHKEPLQWIAFNYLSIGLMLMLLFYFNSCKNKHYKKYYFLPIGLLNKTLHRPHYFNPFMKFSKILLNYFENSVLQIKLRCLVLSLHLQIASM